MTEERNFRVDLTKAEYKLIQEHRLKQFEAAQKAELKKTCNHNFAYSGHGHKDDCYECVICGEMEWR